MSSSGDMSIKEMETMKTFFEYWEYVDNFKTLTDETLKLVEQDIRSAIIDILAMGIEDIDPMTEKQRKRHVLSARELLEQINDRLDSDIKKSNLYFHLQKLEDGELIKVVGQISRGKQSVTYYGRTAKAFTHPESRRRHDLDDIIDKNLVLQLIDRIQNDDTDYSDMLSETYRLYEKTVSTNLLAQWLEKYQDNVLELEIDIRRLFDLFNIFYRFNDKTIGKIREFAEALDFPGYDK